MATTPPDVVQVPGSPDAQREALLDAERAALAQQPRGFKDDALTGKIVSVEPDGTGPTPTQTFDTQTDRQAGSGNGKGDPKGDRQG